VLAAAGIEHRLEVAPEGCRLLVAGEDSERALATLATYERERRPVRIEVPTEYGRTWAGLVVGAVLLGFYLVTGPATRNTTWFQAGGGSAERILDGETWRTVTALTLHADPAHVLSNAVSTTVLLTATGRLLGPGFGTWLVLLAGAAGNALNAWAHVANHNSIGASTSVFGALGILGGLQFGRLRGRRRAWLALAATLALLALLGSDERTDIMAHAFGLMTGLGLGMVVAFLPRPPGGAAQFVFALATVAVVIAAWGAAFDHPWH
jgi:membrane associated rhomboid family serine protease